MRERNSGIRLSRRALLTGALTLVGATGLAAACEGSSSPEGTATQPATPARPTEAPKPATAIAETKPAQASPAVASPTKVVEAPKLPPVPYPVGELTPEARKLQEQLSAWYPRLLSQGGSARMIGTPGSYLRVETQFGISVRTEPINNSRSDEKIQVAIPPLSYFQDHTLPYRISLEVVQKLPNGEWDTSIWASLIYKPLHKDEWGRKNIGIGFKTTPEDRTVMGVAAMKFAGEKLAVDVGRVKPDQIVQFPWK